jgi:lipopolysaccharide/colanic/teichoic acid biosynthesis glycosyltransferase
MATIVNRGRPAYSLEWIERYRPERQWLRGRAYRRAKRIMDLTLSLLAMPIVLPLFVIIALAIKIESPGGPIIFTQNRTGKSGRRFKMYKFRTMVPNAEELKKQLAHLNELQWPDFKITNDPRVTRVGKFLRKTSLDELPQIINVIRGDMSLVGPRPTSFDASTYQLWQTARLDVKPGLTVCGRCTGAATPSSMSACASISCISSTAAWGWISKSWCGRRWRSFKDVEHTDG